MIWNCRVFFRLVSAPPRVHFHRRHHSPQADDHAVHRPAHGQFWPQRLQRFHRAVLGWWYDVRTRPASSWCLGQAEWMLSALQGRSLWSSGSGSDSQGKSPTVPSRSRLPFTKQGPSLSATERSDPFLHSLACSTLLQKSDPFDCPFIRCLYRWMWSVLLSIPSRLVCPTPSWSRRRLLKSQVSAHVGD